MEYITPMYRDRLWVIPDKIKDTTYVACIDDLNSVFRDD